MKMQNGFYILKIYTKKKTKKKFRIVVFRPSKAFVLVVNYSGGD